MHIWTLKLNTLMPHLDVQASKYNFHVPIVNVSIQVWTLGASLHNTKINTVVLKIALMLGQRSSAGKKWWGWIAMKSGFGCFVLFLSAWKEQSAPTLTNCKAEIAASKTLHIRHQFWPQGSLGQSTFSWAYHQACCQCPLEKGSFITLTIPYWKCYCELRSHIHYTRSLSPPPPLCGVHIWRCLQPDLNAYQHYSIPPWLTCETCFCSYGLGRARVKERCFHPILQSGIWACNNQILPHRYDPPCKDLRWAQRDAGTPSLWKMPPSQLGNREILGPSGSAAELLFFPALPLPVSHLAYLDLLWIAA